MFQKDCFTAMPLIRRTIFDSLSMNSSLNNFTFLSVKNTLKIRSKLFTEMWKKQILHCYEIKKKKNTLGTFIS